MFKILLLLASFFFASSLAAPVGDELVKLSVQGTLFALNRESLVSHDWLVAKMLESEVPTQMEGDKLYLNVDAPSFRLIYNILEGIAPLEAVVPRLSGPETALLETTAQYLMCHSLLEQFSVLKTGFESEINDLQKQLEEKEQEINRIKGEIQEHAVDVAVLKHMEDSDICALECSSCNRIPKGRCIVTGNARFVDGKLSCSKCLKEYNGRYIDILDRKTLLSWTQAVSNKKPNWRN